MEKKKVMEELEKVIDPEIGVPITTMGLIDKIEIKDKNVNVDFHLTMPFCPNAFALQIAQEIRKVVSRLQGVEKVKVNLKDHVRAEEINEEVNK